jgi:hypothetical protein
LVAIGTITGFLKFQLKNSEKSLEGPIAFRLQENDTFVINFPKYG